MKDLWKPPDLSGRTAVVAGATRGVGRGIAEAFASHGAIRGLRLNISVASLASVRWEIIGPRGALLRSV